MAKVYRRDKLITGDQRLVQGKGEEVMGLGEGVTQLLLTVVG